MSHSNRSESMLACGHKLILESSPPSAGDELICGFCRKPTHVMTVRGISVANVGEWSFRCELARHNKQKFGTRKLECERKAIAHAKRNRCVVTVYKPDGSIHHVYRDHGETPGQLSLPVTSDEPSY